MNAMATVCQLVLALEIFNVWLLRFRQPTGWRGGSAANMEEELAVYGLPAWSVKVIGSLKLLLAAALIAGVWMPALTRPAAAGMAVLMLAAASIRCQT